MNRTRGAWALGVVLDLLLSGGATWPACASGGGGSVNGPGVTFVGHATVLVEMRGRFFLTDPVFSSRIPGVKREVPPGLDLEALPPLTAVLISHAHFDHLDLPTLERLPPDVPLLLPSGTRGLVGSLPGRRVVEMETWRYWEVPGARVTAVPADHFGGRIMLDSFMRDAVGYVIESGGLAVYFAGDTGPANPFGRIGERFDLDVALLPIGAYRPRWIMRWSHQNPPESLDAFQALGADYMVPIHWGTFKLSLEDLDEPVRWLERAASERGVADRVIVLQPGQSWRPPQPDARQEGAAGPGATAQSGR